ncbi:MAG: hypothetical protein JW969_10965 [Spirochaetales bacterium]|nr:hypothetical protein [Spirochaetales bacterium]
MKRVLSFDDDIFFLILSVKALHDGIKLDIDPQYFVKKIGSDIIHISSVIDQLHASLFEHKTMIKRKSYLKSLSRLKNNFVLMLDDILQTRYPVTDELLGYREKFMGIKESHEKSLSKIRGLLQKSRPAGPDMENMVSEEEIKSLLSSAEEESV